MYLQTYLDLESTNKEKYVLFAPPFMRESVLFGQNKVEYTRKIKS